MDFTQPWDSGDVTFVVDGRKIYANKAVLTMSSEVFRAMFTSDFKEKKMAEIPLPDKKFGDFVIFMHIVHPLPRICVDGSNVEYILPLAHEYQIHRVVECCEKVLVKQPASIHNLILADRFSLPELRKVYFDHLKEAPHDKVEWHPEFLMMAKATRVEVLEHQSMFKDPSIDNLFLAEKYAMPAVYDKCMKYLKDTELTKLKREHGFESLKPSTLIEVLTHKVEMLEPRMRLLEFKVKVSKDRLAELKAGVRHLTSFGSFEDETPCLGTGKRLFKKHISGSDNDCTLCLHARIKRIGHLMMRY